MLILSILSISYAQNANRPANAVAGPPKPIPMSTPIPQFSVIKGRVYYEDTGRPVKRTNIMFMSGSGSPSELSAMTDGDGNFVIKEAKAGTYYPVINAPGVVTPIAYIDLRNIRARGDGPEKENVDRALLNFAPIVVDGINEVYVPIAAKRGAAISGRVMYANGDPAIGVKVEVLRKIDGKYSAVIPNILSVFAMMAGGGGGQTDDRGMYRFAGLPEGEYVVKVSESAQHTDFDEQKTGPPRALMSLMTGGNSLLNFYFPDAINLKDAQALNLLLGQEQSEANIVIPDNRIFNLSGKVISQKDKKPLAGAKLYLQKKGGESSYFDLIGIEMNVAVTDAEGNWKFKEIPKGEYSIKISAENNNRDYTVDDDDEGVSSGSSGAKLPQQKFALGFKDIEVDDKDVSDVIVELGVGATVSGSMAMEGNKELPQSIEIKAFKEGENDPVAVTSIWNYKYDGASNSNYAKIPQKINNEFKLEGVAAGKVTIKFSTGDDAYYLKSARVGAVDLLTTPLEIKGGEMLSGAKIILANDAGTLRGRVLDDKDHAAPGMTITIVPTDDAKRRSGNFTRYVYSDSDGKFEIKLAPGEYFVVFVKPGVRAAEPSQFNSWLEDAVRNAEKVSISPEGTSNISLRKPGE
jgi:hypothetical protein